VGLDSGTPATVDPSLAAAIGTDGDAAHGDHRHAVTGVATEAQITALETAVAPIIDGRRITVGTEITHATKPTSSGVACRWNADHSVLFIGSLTGGGQSLRAYPFSSANPGVFSAPVVATTGTESSNQVAVRPGDTGGATHVATAHTASPWLRIYPWSGSVWSSAIDPGSPPAGAGAPRTVAWRPDGNFVALGRSDNAGNPEVIVFPFDGATIGTGITLAATGQAAGGVAWSPDGLYLFVAWATGNTLRVTAHAFDGVTIGAAIEPASKPDNIVSDVKVSPDGNWVAIATNDSGNKLWVYPWSAGVFGTPVKRATPQGERLAWAPDMAYIGVAYTTPFVSFIAFYPETGTFGAQFDATLTGAPTQAKDIHFSADGAYAGYAADGTTRFGAFPGTRLFGF
jgi:WD40 repeat protein